MHPQTKMFVEMMLKKMAEDGNNTALRKHNAKKIYARAEWLIQKRIEPSQNQKIKDRVANGYIEVAAGTGDMGN